MAEFPTDHGGFFLGEGEGDSGEADLDEAGVVAEEESLHQRAVIAEPVGFLRAPGGFVNPEAFLRKVIVEIILEIL